MRAMQKLISTINSNESTLFIWNLTEGALLIKLYINLDIIDPQ